MEDEIRDLREKNSELVHETQNLKIADAHRQKENLELLKENNELRLKLSVSNVLFTTLRSAFKSSSVRLHKSLSSPRKVYSNMAKPQQC